jgi:predicted nuclease of predicted toxin-antitoxin system
MKFIADENIPLLTVKKLREIGYDVLYISEISPGLSDSEILKIGDKENRIVITFDKDFGELIFKEKISFKAGIIFLRFVPFSPSEPASIISELLNREIPLQGMYSVLTREYSRQRAL